MRILSSLTLTLSLMASPMAFAQESQAPGTPVALQAKMDANLKNILDVVVSALVNRMPNVNKDSSKVELALDSALDQGKANGNFNVVVNSGEGQPVLTTTGKINIGMTRATDGGVIVDVVTDGTLPSEGLIQSLETINKSISETPLLSAEMASLPASEKAAKAFTTLKANIISFIDRSSGSAAPADEAPMFGEEDPMMAADPNAAPTLDPVVAAQLRDIVEKAFNVTSTTGETAFSVDMTVIKAIDSDVAKVNPAISMLMSFESVGMKVGDSEANYSLTSRTVVSNLLVSTYDAYIKQEQAKENGLTNLNVLIGKIGVWAVGRCTTEKYQWLCVDKLLNGCPANLRHVQTCVDQIATVQAGRESGNEFGNGAIVFGMEAGQHVGDGIDATDQFFNDTGTQISNGVGGLWNSITGNNSTETKPE